MVNFSIGGFSFLMWEKLCRRRPTDSARGTTIFGKGAGSPRSPTHDRTRSPTEGKIPDEQGGVGKSDPQPARNSADAMDERQPDE